MPRDPADSAASGGCTLPMMKPFTSLSSLFIVPHRLAALGPHIAATSGERQRTLPVSILPKFLVLFS